MNRSEVEKNIIDKFEKLLANNGEINLLDTEFVCRRCIEYKKDNLFEQFYSKLCTKMINIERTPFINKQIKSLLRFSLAKDNLFSFTMIISSCMKNNFTFDIEEIIYSVIFWKKYAYLHILLTLNPDLYKCLEYSKTKDNKRVISYIELLLDSPDVKVAI